MPNYNKIIKDTQNLIKDLGKKNKVLSDKYADILSKKIENLANASQEEKENATIDFRKFINSLINIEIDPITKKIPIESNPDFQDILYNALIIAAITNPVNTTDVITTEDLDFNSPSLIYLSTGHVFEIQTIAEWLKKRGKMENPLNNEKISHYKDQLALIDAADEININLEELNAKDYKVEEHPAMLDGAVQRLGAIVPDNTNPVSEVKTPFSHFQAASPFLQEIADATGKDTNFLKTYQREHPFRFANVAAALPYIKASLMTFEQAEKLDESKKNRLTLLTFSTENGVTEALRPQVDEILAAPSQHYRHR